MDRGTYFGTYKPEEVKRQRKLKESENPSYIENKRAFRFQNKYLKHKKPLMNNQINYLDSKELTPTIFFYFSRDRVESKARQALA